MSDFHDVYTHGFVFMVTTHLYRLFYSIIKLTRILFIYKYILCMENAYLFIYKKFTLLTNVT